MSQSQAIEAILAVLARIPHGQVISYGQVAERAGWPRRARLVGKILRDAPSDTNLPWHRVLRADGRPAFPPGSEHYRTQVKRLGKEGIPVLRGRVDLKRHGWGLDPDRELWGPPA